MLSRVTRSLLQLTALVCLAACGETRAPAARLAAGGSSGVSAGGSLGNGGSEGNVTDGAGGTGSSSGNGGAGGGAGSAGSAGGSAGAGTGGSGGAAGWPDKGVLFYASFGKEDETLAIDNPWLTGALFQIYWREIETAQGVFDWRELDRRIARWTDAGKYVALRVMWSSSGYWADPVAKTPTPQWVWDAGARFALHAPSGTEIPLFWDPIYRVHALAFLERIAARHEANPRLLFVDVTPGAETNPYRFGTIDEQDPGFRATFVAEPASDQTTYSNELWGATLRDFMTESARRFSSLPLLVTLNAGAMPGDPPRQEEMGDFAVSLGMLVGQNGLRGSSYSTPELQRRWLDWGEQTPLFFEMVAASGADVGTLGEVVDAALRVQASFLNVYATDALRATAGTATYDPAYESALQKAFNQLGPLP